MDFMNDWLRFNEGNMVPKRYTIWAANSILGAALGKAAYVDHGYFRVYAPNYICLVGDQGTRKGSAKDHAMELFREALPDYPIGPSVASREIIIKRLADKDSLRCFQNDLGLPEEWRPMMFFVNELKNFMSFNPQGMIEFLTDIYDRKHFKSDTIVRGAEDIINPCLNILACETPQWITDKLKFNIISGGFARRMLFVYETKRPARITHPKLTDDMKAARERCKEHLKKVPQISGKFTWDKDAYDYFDKWFISLPQPPDELLAGYYEAKDILALKLMMISCVGDYTPKLNFTLDKTINAIQALEAIEDNLPKLSMAAGRNQLAQPMMKIVEMINQKGWMLEKELKNLTVRDIDPREQGAIFSFIREQGTLIPIALNFCGQMERVWSTRENLAIMREAKRWVQTENGTYKYME